LSFSFRYIATRDIEAHEEIIAPYNNNESKLLGKSDTLTSRFDRTTEESRKESKGSGRNEVHEKI
jgi:hypothetical protein